MCMFPRGVLPGTAAYKNGITEFECGVCPECLSKRANAWALRAYAESQTCGEGMMLTLTYDTYIHDSRTGKIIGERVSDLSCNKKDVQDFIKRLRKYFAPQKLKYIACAEYGKRTHRAHYHMLVFGVRFNDCVKYKKSKRGNIIRKSATLDKLWKHGICTVDKLDISAAAARYCTKYAAKDTRADDTFMLFSRDIGTQWLMDNFNGLSYQVDGRLFPVPKTIFNKQVEKHFAKNIIFQKYADKRYVSWQTCEKRSQAYYDELGAVVNSAYLFAFYTRLRRNFLSFKKSWKIYQGYLAFWKRKADERDKIPAVERIRALDKSKYQAYIDKALAAYVEHYSQPLGNRPPLYVPRATYNERARLKWQEERSQRWQLLNLPFSSCHKTANDTFSLKYSHSKKVKSGKLIHFSDILDEISIF